MKKEEYYCTNVEEKEFLINNDINYTFVKTIFDTKNTTCWKFKKTPKLFKLLMEYYS
ncbi:hypothetical protein [Clostridium botulinum]|uniref:hypothetical protein n=1 Tax=Clostridium botulinum TaxID=1491 RepID=UPI000AF2F0D9|nr:hypothetical protein [Clostridium botulinum]